MVSFTRSAFNPCSTAIRGFLRRVILAYLIIQDTANRINIILLCFNTFYWCFLWNTKTNDKKKNWHVTNTSIKFGFNKTIEVIRLLYFIHISAFCIFISIGFFEFVIWLFWLHRICVHYDKTEKSYCVSILTHKRRSYSPLILNFAFQKKNFSFHEIYPTNTDKYYVRLHNAINRCFGKIFLSDTKTVQENIQK